LPRPQILEDVKVVPIVFEKRLYQELTEIARARGISVSALIRQIASTYLSSIGKSQQVGGGSPSNAEAQQQVAVEDPPVDPLVEIDLDEISKSIAKLEDKLARVETEVKRKDMRQSEQAYLMGMWNDIKKKYMRIRRQAPKHRAMVISKKLAELKKRIDKLA